MEDWKAIAQQFQDRWNIPHALEALDVFQPGAPGGPPPQQWQPGMGPPPTDFRQGQGPPMGGMPMPPPGAMGPPPMQGMPMFQGYQGVGGFGMMAPMPPPPPPPPPQGDPPHMQFDSLAELDEQQVREAMMQFVSENCCYGKGPVKEMVVDEILPHNALHYTLETFCEERRTGYVSEPYRGGLIDGPENGIPPPPFAIQCNPDTGFEDHVKLVEVPHTATIKPCHKCEARGYLKCRECHGWGQTRCHACHGEGRMTRHDPERGPYEDVCFSCHGDGKVSCNNCGGDGRIVCDECEGFSQLKCFIQMKVTYTNHLDDYIREETDLPDELIRNVEGAIVFEQVMLPVWPISCYPLPEINQASIGLCEKHRGAFTNEKYLQQRQRLRSVPVTEVKYTWDEGNYRYWVYGKERKVYCPDYPKQCCCVIL